MIDSLSDAPSTARTIPLEREAPKQFSFFQHIEGIASTVADLTQTCYRANVFFCFPLFSIIESLNTPGGKPLHTTKSPWDPQEYDGSTAFLRRGSFQDVDMRSDANCKPIHNVRPLGRGSGLLSSSYSSPWDSENNRSEYFGQNGRNEKFKDRNRVDGYDRNSQSGYRGRANDSSRSNTNERITDAWEDDDWEPSNSRQSGRDFEQDEDYNRRGNSRDHPSHYNQSRSGSSGSQQFSNYERSGTSNFTAFDRRAPDSTPARNQEENMFERRPSQPQFDRRTGQPANPVNTDSSSVQIDYNHGGNGADALGQSWEDPTNAAPGLSFVSPPNPTGFVQQQQQHLQQQQQQHLQQQQQQHLQQQQQQQQQQHLQQQQMFMATQGMNQMGFQINHMGSPQVNAFIPGTNPPGSNAHMLGMNVVGGVFQPPSSVMGMNATTGSGGVPPTPSALGVSSGPGLMQQPGASLGIRIPSSLPYQHQPAVNNRPGLLPTPTPTAAAHIPQRPATNFGFRNPTGSQVRPQRPLEPSRNQTITSPSTSSSARMSMSEISKQKAQQCFAQPRGPSTSYRPRIATNQMVSDRDPRLNRLNPAKGPSQGNQTSRPSDFSSSHGRSPSDSSGDRRVERIPRDPRESSRDRDRERDRDRGRDRDSRERSGSSSDPRVRSKDHSSQDPRLSSSRRDDNLNERSEGVDVHSASKSGGDRSRNVDVRGSMDDSRDRTSRSNDQDESLKRLDEVRNRVRANMVKPKSAKPIVPDKLQEIRKQVAKEGFHALGRPLAGKKNQTSFDDAIVAPAEMTSVSRSPNKQTSAKGAGNKDVSSKEKDIENNKGGQKKVTKKASDATSNDNANKKIIGKRRRIIAHDSDESDTEKEPGKGKRPIKGKGKKSADTAGVSKKPNKNKSPNPSTDASKTSKTGANSFRIPKIKRPEPPRPPTPPPGPPSPVGVEDTVNDAPDEACDGLSHDTEQLIKEFIRQSVDPTEADTILNNQSAISLVFQKLKQQVKQMCMDDTPAATSSSVADSTTGLAQDEPITDSPSQSTSVGEPKDVSEVPDSQRSRSVVRKKNTKRRSSLEKLHDALKEMRFDTMLPLGPRRCTVRD
jgi:hypothetical protein